jgi:predicted phage replisome organizer
VSDNKKYYYLKFKENYFDQDHIRVIESAKNGHIYSLILIKLYLKSLKYDGQLRVNEAIPYHADKIDMLASVINHDPDHVSKAINIAKSLGVVEIQESGEIWIADIQNFIGHSSTEAERKAIYRDKLKNNNVLTDKRDKNGTMSQKFPPEIEIEIEKEIDINNSSESSSKPVYTFTCVKGEIYSVTTVNIDTYKRTYPACDIHVEILRMQQWLSANPTKKKTKRGMPKFINGWLSRTQDKGGTKGYVPCPKEKEKSLDEIWRNIEHKQKLRDMQES